MGKVRWSPGCVRPSGLVVPVRAGRDITHSEARRRAWRNVGPGWYVDDAAAADAVEQRILEQSVRLPTPGAVTGWAALRWRGAAFFDGRADGGRTELPVPLLVGVGNIRGDRRVAISKEQLPPDEREIIDGVPCTVAERAVFDEMRRTRNLNISVAAVDMAAAAGLVSVESMAAYILHRPAWTGVPHARKALALSTDDSRSPQETRMRLVWVIDARLPPPLCNQPIFGPDGSLLGEPDLFDPAAGVVGEYDGAHHLEDDQRRADRDREECFRDHGLEYFAVVIGELGDRARVATRMRRAHSRAVQRGTTGWRWTLEQPDWYAGYRRSRDRHAHLA